MYGKLFQQMYDGTLGTKGPWQALVTFQQMVILADKDGVVDMTPEVISRRTTVPLEIIAVGIAALEQPDQDSRTPDEEGRRIVLLSDGRSWGWRVVNHAHYRAIRSTEERREYHRQYAKTRGQPKTQQSQPEQPETTNSSKQEAEAVSSKQVKDLDYSPEFEALWHEYPKRAGGNPKRLADRSFNARLAEGVTPEAMRDGMTRYRRFIEATGKLGTEYVMQAARFFGPDRPFEEEWAIPASTGKPIGRIEAGRRALQESIDRRERENGQ